MGAYGDSCIHRHKEQRMNMKEMQAEAVAKQRDKAFKAGICFALDYLREVYGAGIEETDIWKEYN
jgi:hypothetical protein